MSRILVTGMSGAGKSTLLVELARRGLLTVDTDYGGWVTAGGLWDVERMDELLARETDVVVSGAVENQGRFYDRFEHIVFLTAPVQVLIQRVVARESNPYGRTAEQQAEIRRNAIEVEPELRRGATLVLDGRRPVEALADAVQALPSERPGTLYRS